MIPKFREWDAEREKLFKGKGMSYGVRKDFDNSFRIEFEHIEDLDAINKDGSIDRVVMMSTTLKDKNNVEIYEGDIVKNEYAETYVVKWLDAGFYLEEKYNGGFDYSELHFGDNKKIIGNIYENPELLEDN
ncbi:YopX family protein [Staphylococcus hominis]|uniref:YopX family protein n=1 Tax=Staphylococcus hominis TaxID=1290 RepID=UPI00287AC954|nr:YopX family protein [Staphylococcus hominis]MDS3899863.1 YopX family protein [Staphylococcus hominis]MDS3899926.1 YopX family protein [Staphylococcus hominis]